jgi:hypothetical protein
MTETTSAFQLSLNGHRAPVAYDRREFARAVRRGRTQ